MSVNLGTVHASIELRLDKLKSAIRDAKGEFAGLESDTKRRAERIGQSLTSLGRSMTIGITAPLVLMGKSAVESAVRMDSLTRSLTSLTGDAKETEKQLGRLREAAKLPGLGFRELIEGSVRLQSAGLSARQAEDALKGFGNALALAGGSKEDLREVGVQLAQIASSGKLQGDELRIIAERVPQVRAVLKEAFGTASAEEISKFGLSVDQILGAITTGLEKLPQATDSVQNKFDNFNDTLDDLKRTVGNAFLPAVTEGLDLIARKVEEATKWFKELDPAAKNGLGQLAVGGAIMGPALLGLGALFAMFTKLGNSPFFKFLSGKLPIVGPLSALAVKYTGPAELQERALSLLPPEQQAKLRKMQADAQAEQIRADAQRAAMEPFTYDPVSGKVRKKILPPLGGMGLKTDWAAKAKAIQDAKDAAKRAAAEAKRRAEFGAEYADTADIEVLRQTPGRQFTTLLREAEKEYRDSVAKGAKRADAEKVLVAKVKAIWTEHDKWDAGRLERVRTREAAINEERLSWALKGVQLAKVAGGTEIGAIPVLAHKPPRLSGRPGGLQTSGAWAKFGRWLKGPKAGTLSDSQVAQGQDLLSTMGQLAELEQQRKLDELKPGFKKPIGDLFGAGLAQELKPKVQPFTFELGKVLGDNLAMEMGREFGNSFDKIFGTGNPLSRALSNTLSRLVDDLMYSLAQRALGSRLILSLFGGGAAGAAGGATAAAGMTGAALMGGGTKAAAAKAGAAAGASFGIAFAAMAGIVIAGNLLKRPGSAKSQQIRYGMQMAGFQGGASGYMGSGGDPRINPAINFYGAQFNNDQDPERAASRMAWHLDQKMRSRPGS